MSTTIYLIRHGQSKANEKEVFAGFYNIELTQKGKDQAKLTANFLKEIKPDYIYSSDLIRAYDTATFTAENYGMEIIADQQLREMDAGEWDGLTLTEIKNKYEKEFYLWRNDIGNAYCHGGETTRQVQERIVKKVTEIAKAHKDKVVFIFSHATAIRTFSAYCKGLTFDQMKDLPWPSNASVTKVQFENDKFELLEYSIDSFMGDESTVIPTNV